MLREIAFKLKDEIARLKSKGYRDPEIAKRLDISLGYVHKIRTAFGIRQTWRKAKTLEFKTWLCDVLNKEDPFDCLKDKEIAAMAGKAGMPCNYMTISRCRWELKIPLATHNNEEGVTRRYLYLTQGRIIWSPSGNHKYKNGKSIWK